MKCEECKWWLGGGMGSSGICDNPSSMEFGKITNDGDNCDGFERYYGVGKNDLESEQEGIDGKGAS